MMHKSQFQVQVNKKNIKLLAQTLVFYKHSKILEATDEKSNYYYLVFYNNQFINGVKRNEIKLHSYIHHAFTKGIHFKGTHPLTTKLLQHDKPFQLVTFNQLYKHIQKSHSKLDTIFTLSCFDSFTKSGSIDKLVQRTFYEFRRNGQNFTAYKLLKTYRTTAHSNKFVRDMLNDLQYQKYNSLYQDLEQIIEKDPMYVESVAFDTFLSDEKSKQLLLQLYKRQNRSLDELAVRIALLNKHFSSEQFAGIISFMKDLTTPEQIELLLELKQTPPVQEQLMKLILTSGNSNTMVHFLMTSNYKPSAEQLTSVLDGIEQANPDILISCFELSNNRLIQLCNEDAHSLEKLVKPFVSAFLQNYSVNEILDWMRPFKKAGFSLPIERKLKKMKALKEDPDQQFELGELYVQFHQLEKSIDCFKWEMELRPNDPKPVTYLSNIYKQLGNHEEATAYKQLLIQMSK